MSEKICVVVPWHNEAQIEKFCEAWGIAARGDARPTWLVLQQDKHKEGCAVTKNKGVREAMERGAEIVVVLDDDCFPATDNYDTLFEFAELHAEALESQTLKLCVPTTNPASRGTPYEEKNRTVTLPVAASMGFWSEVGDYCAPGQLVHGATKPMEFKASVRYQNYFPVCGMNLAFRPREWLPWCEFIDVPRFDDIWMGWLWQKEAYRRGYCFNLNGPLVRHVRQSNVWANLRAEAPHLERNETLWRDIALSAETEYGKLKALI